MAKIGIYCGSFDPVHIGHERIVKESLKQYLDKVIMVPTKDYWDKKMTQNPNYNVMYDNDVSTSDEQKKFEIRKSDIDNVNFNEIGKSFRLDDFLNF